jgi:hypothetical protein
MPITPGLDDQLGSDDTSFDTGETNPLFPTIILPDTAAVMEFVSQEDGLGTVEGFWNDINTFPCAILQATKMTGFVSATEKVEAGALKAVEIWDIAFSLAARWIITSRSRLRIPPDDDLQIGRPAEYYDVIGTDPVTSNTSTMVAKCVKIDRSTILP